MTHRHITRTVPTVAGLLVAGVALAACGSGSGGNGGLRAAGNGNSGAAAVVKTMSVPSVGTVLVDGSGHALYTPEQEANGKILCTKGCTAVWPPLTLPSGASLPSVSGLSGTLGTVARPDGTRQLTLGGKPLYRFSFDGAGKVSGNGKSDSFGGRSFTWHVVTATGAAAPTSPADTSGSGGYNY